MTRIPLTPRPRAPVLVHTAALGTLAFASAACGDDGSTSTTNVSTTDVFPTAGPCYHQDPPPPECASTTDGGSDSGTATDGTTGTGTSTGTGTGTTSG